MTDFEKMLQMIEEYENSGGDPADFKSHISALAADNATPFLKLNQWKRSDKPVMDDFNDDNRKIDNAVRELWTNKMNAAESGVWTPTLTGTVKPGANTYSLRTGTWEKIGDFMFITCRILLTAKDASMDGLAVVTGLPEDLLPKGFGSGSFAAIDANTPAGCNYVTVQVEPTRFSFMCTGSASYLPLNSIHISNTSRLYFTAFYSLNS